MTGQTTADGGKGRCPFCYGRFRIRKNGTLWTHNGDERDGIWRLRCTGSGEVPQ